MAGLFADRGDGRGLGFMQFVDQVRDVSGSAARVFPLLTPGPKGGLGEAWSKWFGRYIRGLGITNRASVFHSFRHSFKDALRAAGVSEDVNDALTGHSEGGVGRAYGAKEMVRRFGLSVLAQAVANVAYPGLEGRSWRSVVEMVRALYPRPRDHQPSQRVSLVPSQRR